MTSGYKHGHSRTKLYRVFTNIKTRVDNPNHPQYQDYGGRGITLCDEWRNDYMSFYNWAQESGYKAGLTIDRIDTNGNYEPSNCRWVTMEVQTRNRRSTKLITYNGVARTAKEWSFHLGGSENLVVNRLKKGWSEEEAVSTPPNLRK